MNPKRIGKEACFFIVFLLMGGCISTRITEMMTTTAEEELKKEEEELKKKVKKADIKQHCFRHDVPRSQQAGTDCFTRAECESVVRGFQSEISHLRDNLDVWPKDHPMRQGLIDQIESKKQCIKGYQKLAPLLPG